MYTANIIEGLNYQYRKVIKTKNVFPVMPPLKRCVYLASGNIRKKWNQRYHGCDQVLNQ